jgi:uroporphyrinogen III methyltransferase / synthase
MNSSTQEMVPSIDGRDLSISAPIAGIIQRITVPPPSLFPMPAYLLGSGCGTIDLLTLRGVHLLQTAEIVIYDALVDSSILTLLAPDCEPIYVGKRGGIPSLKQPEIDRILVEACQRKSRVVRLKTGDPFIFGRTTSEIQALRSAGIAYEVIPGISSAIAAPLFASIPLTDLVLSKSFTVFSAHDVEILDWQTFARLDTLVILMGAKTLPDIIQLLVRQGKSTRSAIAIIRAAGQPDQQIWTGTMGNILQLTKGESLSPCIIVIGEVVRLREFLMPIVDAENLDPDSSSENPNSGGLGALPETNRPLAHHTILVTRSAEQSATFTNLLTDRGATVIEMPTLEITPPSSWEGLDTAIAQIQIYDWLILTSANAVEYFFDRFATLNYDLRSLAGIKIAVVGKKTAQFLKKRGFNPDFTPPDFVADSLIEHFPDSLTQSKILFPRVESGGREVLVQAFTAAGAIVTEVAAYQSGCPTEPDATAIAALQSQQITIVTFASSKTVKHFYRLLEQSFGTTALDRLTGIQVASIGPQTSKTCQELLGRVDMEATEYTLEGLVDAICLGTASR